MKNRGIIPDTCAWIDYFRPGETPLGASLAHALSTGIVYSCGPVVYELVQGVRSIHENEMLINSLTALPFLELTATDWIKAGQRAAALRKSGMNIPLSDILIATLAIEHDLAVMTVDRHFEAISGLILEKVGN